MRRNARSWPGWAVVAVAAVAGTLSPVNIALALEEEDEDDGEFTEETRAKLERLVTIEEDHLPLAALAGAVSEQTGLSFTASALVARLPEPVAIVARDAPAGELIEAVAFAMHLDYHITPGGIVAFRMELDDPRYEALLSRVYRTPREGERDRERRHGEGPPPRGGPPPEVDEGEVVDRAAEHPKVRAILEKFDAELFPAEFIPGKRVWALAVRRGGDGDEPGRGQPVARVFTDEFGEVVHIEMQQKNKAKPPKGRKGEDWRRKGREEQPNVREDGERF